MKGALPFLPLVALLGCNQYVMLRVTGFEQENYNNDADILFVVDNSDSMQPVAEGLALAFNDFITTLTSSEGANASRETLGDAVSNYIRETSGDTLLLDYQLAITTTSGVSPAWRNRNASNPPSLTTNPLEQIRR